MSQQANGSDYGPGGRSAGLQRPDQQPSSVLGSAGGHLSGAPLPNGPAKQTSPPNWQPAARPPPAQLAQPGIRGPPVSSGHTGSNLAPGGRGRPPFTGQGAVLSQPQSSHHSHLMRPAGGASMQAPPTPSQGTPQGPGWPAVGPGTLPQLSGDQQPGLPRLGMVPGAPHGLLPPPAAGRPPPIRPQHPPGGQPAGAPPLMRSQPSTANRFPRPPGPLTTSPPSTSFGGMADYGAQPRMPGPLRPGFRPPGQQPTGAVSGPQAPSFRGGPLADKSTSSTARIDPASMPRPQPQPEEPQVFPTRQEGKAMLPLPAECPIIVQDMGNCSPRNMRLTLNCVPASSDLLQQSSMPLAVLIQPLAPTQPGEAPLQVVDMGAEGPVRCAKCKAYMNPFMQFSDYGRKFTCNLCLAPNATPHDYVENVGPDGRRRDADERSELCCGSVEFVATPHFQVRPPMPPTHFFLIDVTHAAVTSGATAAACRSIARNLDDLQGGESARVGVATFDSSVHFYSLRASQAQPQMLVVPDVDAPYAPLPGSLVVPLQASRGLVEALLHQIPRMFGETQVLDACATAAIEAAASALKGGVGGKLHVFASSLPKVGTKALVVRDAGGRTNEREPLKVMEPASKEYRELAESAADGMVSIDLFLLAQSFVDVATLGMLTHITSGQLYLYQPFKDEVHGDQLFNDLRWNLVRPQGWEAVGRLRASEGLVIERYLGPHYRRTLTDLDLPAVHADTSIAVQLRHSERLPDNKEAYLQFALLYTNSQRQRRIRVHTIGLPVTSVMGTVFRGADADSQVNYLARSLAFQVPGGKLGAIRDQAYKTAVDVLSTYRTKCASASATGQLILPESLKLLPLYCLALTKMPAFRADCPADVRAAWLMRLESLAPERTLPLVYPRLFALGSLLAALPKDPSQLCLPPAIHYLSSSKLAEDGVFLLENGFEAYLQFGERTPPDLLMSILGVPSLDVLARATPQLLSLPVFDTAASRAVHVLMDMIRRQRGRFLPLQVMPPVPPHMSPFYTSLVEDKIEGMSYVEHLIAVHRDIQRKFS